MSPKDKDKETLRCSFCGKPQDEVLKLIAGPSVRICDGCVSICNEILADEGLADAFGVPRMSFGQNVGNFTCPQCQTSFVLHSQHVEPPGRQTQPTEDDPRREA